MFEIHSEFIHQGFLKTLIGPISYNENLSVWFQFLSTISHGTIFSKCEFQFINLCHFYFWNHHRKFKENNWSLHSWTVNFSSMLYHTNSNWKFLRSKEWLLFLSIFFRFRPVEKIKALGRLWKISIFSFISQTMWSK